jgi:hypothetical protein
MDERKVSPKEGSEYLSAFGNENILRNHIVYFEKKIEVEFAPYKGKYFPPFHYFPNFSAWVRLTTEYTCNRTLWRLHIVIGNWKEINELKFFQIKDRIYKIIEQEIANERVKISKSDFKKMKEALNFVFELRHSFQHGGLPNPMRKEKCKIDENELIRLLAPKNFEKLKEKFSNANKLLELLPRKTIIVRINK